MAGGHVFKEGFETFVHSFTQGGKELGEKEAREAAEKFAKEEAERAEREAAEQASKEAGEGAVKQGAKEGVERLSKEMRSTIKETESALGKTSEYKTRSARVIGEGENARYLTEKEFKSLEDAEQTVKKYDNALETRQKYGKADDWEFDEAKQAYHPKEGGPAGRTTISKSEFDANVTDVDKVLKSAEGEEFKSAQELVNKYSDVGGSRNARETIVYEHPSKLGNDGQPLKLTEDEFEGLGMMERAYKEDNSNMFKAGRDKMGSAVKGAWNNPIGNKIMKTAIGFGIGAPVAVGAVSALATGNPLAGAEAVGTVYSTYGQVTGAVGQGLGAVADFASKNKWVLALGVGALALGVLGRGSMLGTIAKIGVGATAIGFIMNKGSDFMMKALSDKEGTTEKLDAALGIDSSKSNTAQNNGTSAQQAEVSGGNTEEYVKVDTSTINTMQHAQAAQEFSV